MENLFFNSTDDLEKVSKTIFSVISKDIDIQKRESSNVYLGEYTSIKIGGANISIELNSYDYEDDYKYMLSIKEDFLADIEISKEDLKKLTNVIAHTIVNSIENIDLMYETANEDLVKVQADEDLI